MAIFHGDDVLELCSRQPQIQTLHACPAGPIYDAAIPPATVIAERVGWDRGLTVLKDRVRGLRPVYLPPDPASRTAYGPGELAQCDFWFPPVSVSAGSGQLRRPAQLPVLTMVSGYSRWLSAVLVPSRHGARRRPAVAFGHEGEGNQGSPSRRGGKEAARLMNSPAAASSLPKWVPSSDGAAGCPSGSAAPRASTQS